MLRTYRRRWLRYDLVAGVVLAAILVPQGMAYAELAGVPAVTGLYMTIFCLIGYALFGPSVSSCSGRICRSRRSIFAAIVSLVVADDPAEAITLAAMLVRRGHRGRVGVAKLGFVADLCRRRCRSCT